MALFVSLGGTAMAGSLITSNSPATASRQPSALAQKINYLRPPDINENPHRVLRLGDLTLSFSCFKGLGPVFMRVYAKSARPADINYFAVDQTDNGNPVLDEFGQAIHNSANGGKGTQVLAWFSSQTGTGRVEAQAIYHNKRGQVATVALNVAIAGASSCQLDGTATPGN